ncbi:DNA repair exonuclease SbcCD ATPase subunit [Dethiosulfatibacter aminovorans DSM 17477]|uniref:DNA repair exonuclease SbcCD ATPase subunit n=1 Tax=Dethiosulfatibacter aminovorans DSM 17477 TaxID=1121476 RepID=A0A1M6FBH0_9FIRM|nr:AAA family ATPase [Dethiosulfatibacter aminovorans]SHI95001.1 DNA repair exonuclease SbcCD ATPase subunit [Dethiosulfatibacter aminovorans DSM 17477]
MIINRLNLLNFGKFKDKEIDFSNGINLIYGHNEAGKSTMHKFIEGMLYGFHISNGNAENNWLGDMEKFNPWTEESYNGELFYSQNGEKVKIYRDFYSNDVKITDASGTHDLGERFKYSKKHQVIEPGKTIFGINRRMFANTFSINQLGSKTDENLVGDVKEKIENLAKSKDESLKIKHVFDDLEEMKEKMGNPEDPSSKAGRILKKLESLEEEMALREEADGKTSRKLMLVDAYRKQLIKKQKDYDNIENIIGELDTENIKESYGTACELSDEIEALNGEIGSNEIHDINIEDYERLIRLFMKSEQYETREKELAARVKALERTAKTLKEGLIIGNESVDFEKMNSSYEILQSNKGIEGRLEKKINAINEEIDVFENNRFGATIESYEKYYANQKKIKYYKGILESDIIAVLKNKIKKEKSGAVTNTVFSLILGGLIAVGSHIAARYFYNDLFYIALVLLVVPAFNCRDIFRSRRIIKAVKSEIGKIEKGNAEKLEEQKRLEDENRSILEETDCTSLNDLKAKYNIATSEIGNITEKKSTLETLEEEHSYIKRKNDNLQSQLVERVGIFGYNELSSGIFGEIRRRIEESREKSGNLKVANQELESVGAELETVTKNRKDNDEVIAGVLERNGVESVEELKHQIMEQRYIQDKVLLRKAKMESLRNILGKYTLEEMKTKIDKLELLFSNSEYGSKEEILEAHRNDLKEIKDLEDKVKNLVENISLKQKGHRKLSEIAEEMDCYKRQMKELEEELEIINKTQSVIEKASQNIQEEFLPKFIRKINHYFSLITDRKYNEIRLDEHLNLSVVDPSSNLEVFIESLSAGTVDQIYLSLRFALVDIISRDDDSPVILDDCFTQYDYKRLASAVDIMGNMGKERQILLFSCQSREKDIFDAKGIPYNYIEI